LSWKGLESFGKVLNDTEKVLELFGLFWGCPKNILVKARKGMRVGWDMFGNSRKHPQATGMVSRHPVNVRVNAGKMPRHVGNSQFIPKTSWDHL
jgi:hypothetical protein